MEQLNDNKLRAYSVWVPILLTDAERAVPTATKRLPDQRVIHFWDAQGELVEAYKTILPTKNEETGEYIKAWDVYLLFAPGIEWKDQPPQPTFWMHQLYSVDPKNAFDSRALATEVQRLLK
jgi:hypothetical protein